MAMGVVAPPCDANDHNGGIFFKRVSKMKPYQKTTYSTHLSDVARINQELRDGKWKEKLVDNADVETATWGQLREQIGLTYDLDDDVTERLVLKYYSGTRRDQRTGEDKPVAKYISEDNHIFGPGEIDLINPQLAAKYEKGEEREVDCSCDSDFMMSVMDDVGKSIREAYSRVPPEDVIYLGMDNAGGHGKKDIIKEYEQLLKNKYNIIILWQQPRTPESNMLDLGIWMHLQSLVEEKHFGRRVHAESLWKTMQSVWDIISAQALTNVYARWIKVLDLIIEGEGSSHLVEKKRGRFFSVPSDEAEVFDGAEDGDVDGSDAEGEDEDDGEEAWCDL